MEVGFDSSHISSKLLPHLHSSPSEYQLDFSTFELGFVFCSLLYLYLCPVANYYHTSEQSLLNANCAQCDDADDDAWQEL